MISLYLDAKQHPSGAKQPPAEVKTGPSVASLPCHFRWGELREVILASLATSPSITFAELLRVFTRIGFLSFGGPAGQIALMHRELVD